MPRDGLGALGIAASIVAAVLLATLALEREPTATPEGSDPRAFSGLRAQALRQDLLSTGEPHPVGSGADDRVRAHVMQAFERLGFAPTLEEGWACGAWGTCARVRNVTATAPGTEGGPPVLVSAHDDSVGSGPGASDDGAGVAAALEIARALQAEGPRKHAVRFVITDGEEAGLIGARADVARHPEAPAAVVNLEARGTHGPALIFETGTDGADVIQRIASSVGRPLSSSLFAAVYKVLPNDTDFTVLRRGDVPGANIAFIEGAAQYHTPLDDLAHASTSSLQHEGETGLALVRAFASLDGESRSREPYVWFDVVSRALVRWPARLSAPLSALGLVLLAAAAARARSRGLGVRLAWAFGASVGATLAAALASVALGFLLYLTHRVPAPWIAHPAPSMGAAVALGVLATVLLLGRVRERWARFCAAWFLWGCVSLGVSLALPGASYLFVPPVITAGIAGVLGARARRRQACMIAPIVVLAVVWAPPFLLIPVALGTPAIPVLGFLGALCALTLAPLLPDSPRLRRPVAAVWAGIALVLAAASFVVPPFSRDAPQRLNVLYLQQDRGDPRWLLEGSWAGFHYGAPPEAMLRAAAFDPTPIQALPFRLDTMRAAPAPDLAFASPELAIVAREDTPSGRIERLHLRSGRGAPGLTLALPPSTDLRRVVLEGARQPPQSATARRFFFGGWSVLSLLAVPPDGVDLELELGARDPVEGVLVDHTAGLPSAGQPLESARPDWSQPSQDGDGALVLRHVRL